MRVLKVALPLPLDPLDYLPPLGEGRPPLGLRVAVPLRGRVEVGVVVGEGEGEGPSLRHALAYLDPTPYLRPEEVAFLEEAARYLFSPLGQVLADLLPPFPPLRHRVRLHPGLDLPPHLPPRLRDWGEARGLDPRLLDELRAAGALEEEVAFKEPRRVLVLLRRGHPDPEAERVLALLEGMGQAESLAALARAAGVGVRRVKALLEEGYLAYAPQGEAPQGEGLGGAGLPPLPWPEGVSRLHGGRFLERVRRLMGLAGEGDFLVLFPEVSLLERFLPYFPRAKAYHGGLSPWAREALFRAPRGLIFATYGGLLLPFTPKALVVVEEGSESYKLPSGTRAWVPALAELRAKTLGVPLYHLSLVPGVEVLDRPGRILPVPKPRLLTVDLRKEGGYPLTGRAWALLRQAEAKGYQAFILTSRVGYSAYLVCPSCGYKPTCPHCDLPLAYHKRGKGGVLLCHQCGHREPPPLRCPVCGSLLLEPRGPGLDWVWEEVRKGLGVPVYRYAKDTKDDLGPLLRGEPGVVVGTTAFLRGPSLPIALVLLPFADAFFLAPDFRAEERYHRLLWALTELWPGHRPLLVLQTFQPHHPVHQALARGEVGAFPEEERGRRLALGYPPAARLLKLEVTHPKEEVAASEAFRLLEALQGQAREGEVLGPSPAPLPRVKGVYVYHLLLRGDTARLAYLLGILRALPGFRRVRLDPDPHRFHGLLED